MSSATSEDNAGDVLAALATESIPQYPNQSMKMELAQSRIKRRVCAASNRRLKWKRSLSCGGPRTEKSASMCGKNAVNSDDIGRRHDAEVRSVDSIEARDTKRTAENVLASDENSEGETSGQTSADDKENPSDSSAARSQSGRCVSLIEKHGETDAAYTRDDINDVEDLDHCNAMKTDNCLYENSAECTTNVSLDTTQPEDFNNEPNPAADEKNYQGGQYTLDELSDDSCVQSRHITHDVSCADILERPTPVEPATSVTNIASLTSRETNTISGKRRDKKISAADKHYERMRKGRVEYGVDKKDDLIQGANTSSSSNCNSSISKNKDDATKMSLQIEKGNSGNSSLSRMLYQQSTSLKSRSTPSQKQERASEFKRQTSLQSTWTSNANKVSPLSGPSLSRTLYQRPSSLKDRYTSSQENQEASKLKRHTSLQARCSSKEIEVSPLSRSSSSRRLCQGSTNHKGMSTPPQKKEASKFERHTSLQSRCSSKENEVSRPSRPDLSKRLCHGSTSVKSRSTHSQKRETNSEFRRQTSLQSECSSKENGASTPSRPGFSRRLHQGSNSLKDRTSLSHKHQETSEFKRQTSLQSNTRVNKVTPPSSVSRTIHQGSIRTRDPEIQRYTSQFSGRSTPSQKNSQRVLTVVKRAGRSSGVSTAAAVDNCTSPSTFAGRQDAVPLGTMTHGINTNKSAAVAPRCSPSSASVVEAVGKEPSKRPSLRRTLHDGTGFFLRRPEDPTSCHTVQINAATTDTTRRDSTADRTDNGGLTAAPHTPLVKLRPNLSVSPIDGSRVSPATMGNDVAGSTALQHDNSVSNDHGDVSRSSRSGIKARTNLARGNLAASLPNDTMNSQISHAVLTSSLLSDALTSRLESLNAQAHRACYRIDRLMTGNGRIPESPSSRANSAATVAGGDCISGRHSSFLSQNDTGDLHCNGDFSHRPNHHGDGNEQKVWCRDPDHRSVSTVDHLRPSMDTHVGGNNGQLRTGVPDTFSALTNTGNVETVQEAFFSSIVEVHGEADVNARATDTQRSTDDYLASVAATRDQLVESRSDSAVVLDSVDFAVSSDEQGSVSVHHRFDDSHASDRSGEVGEACCSSSSRKRVSFDAEVTSADLLVDNNDGADVCESGSGVVEKDCLDSHHSNRSLSASDISGRSGDARVNSQSVMMSCDSATSNKCASLSTTPLRNGEMCVVRVGSRDEVPSGPTVSHCGLVKAEARSEFSTEKSAAFSAQAAHSEGSQCVEAVNMMLLQCKQALDSTQDIGNSKHSVSSTGTDGRRASYRYQPLGGATVSSTSDSDSVARLASLIDGEERRVTLSSRASLISERANTAVCTSARSSRINDLGRHLLASLDRRSQSADHIIAPFSPKPFTSRDTSSKREFNSSAKNWPLCSARVNGNDSSTRRQSTGDQVSCASVRAAATRGCSWQKSRSLSAGEGDLLTSSMKSSTAAADSRLPPSEDQEMRSRLAHDVGPVERGARRCSASARLAETIEYERVERVPRGILKSKSRPTSPEGRSILKCRTRSSDERSGSRRRASVFSSASPAEAHYSRDATRTRGILKQNHRVADFTTTTACDDGRTRTVNICDQVRFEERGRPRGILKPASRPGSPDGVFSKGILKQSSSGPSSPEAESRGILKPSSRSHSPETESRGILKPLSRSHSPDVENRGILKPPSRPHSPEAENRGILKPSSRPHSPEMGCRGILKPPSRPHSPEAENRGILKPSSRPHSPDADSSDSSCLNGGNSSNNLADRLWQYTTVASNSCGGAVVGECGAVVAGQSLSVHHYCSAQRPPEMAHLSEDNNNNNSNNNNNDNQHDDDINCHTPVEIKTTGAIKDRLAALQHNGESQWRRRVVARGGATTSTPTSPPCVRLRNRQGCEGRDSGRPLSHIEVLSERLQQSSEQNWKRRVPVNDAHKFTVASKMGQVLSPLRNLIGCQPTNSSSSFSPFQSSAAADLSHVPSSSDIPQSRARHNDSEYSDGRGVQTTDLNSTGADTAPVNIPAVVLSSCSSVSTASSTCLEAAECSSVARSAPSAAAEFICSRQSVESFCDPSTTSPEAAAASPTSRNRHRSCSSSSWQDSGLMMSGEAVSSGASLTISEPACSPTSPSSPSSMSSSGADDVALSSSPRDCASDNVVSTSPCDVVEENQQQQQQHSPRVVCKKSRHIIDNANAAKSTDASTRVDSSEEMVVVEVPSLADEQFSAFFTPIISQHQQHEEQVGSESCEQNDSVCHQDWTLNMNTQQMSHYHTHRLTSLASRQRVRRKVRTVGNPLRALQSRHDLVSCYRQQQQQQQKQRTGATGALSNLSPIPTTGRLIKPQLGKKQNLAQEALAGLMARVDFSSVKLTCSNGRSPVGADFLPYRQRAPMLIQLKGRRHVQCRLVAPCPASVNSGDCYLLVNGDQLIAYMGGLSNKMERSRTADLGSHVAMSHELGCSASELVVLDYECQQRLNSGRKMHERRFWQTLCSSTDQQDTTHASVAGDPGEDEAYETAVIGSNRVYEVLMSSTDKLLPLHEWWSRLPRACLLQDDKVFVFDFGSELYLWTGRLASQPLRQLGKRLARQLWRSDYDYSQCGFSPIDGVGGGSGPLLGSRPAWGICGRVGQNMETFLFREKFLDWNDASRVIKVRTDMGNDSVGASRAVVSAATVCLRACSADLLLHSQHEQPDLRLEMDHLGRGDKYYDQQERRLFEVDTLGVTSWHVSEAGASVVPAASLGQLFSEATYVFRWSYRVTQTGRTLRGAASKHQRSGRHRCAYLFWQGSGSSITEKGASALLTIELDEERGPQLRVCEGREPAAFLGLFAGRLVIHRGDPRDRHSDQWRLFIVRGECTREAHLLQVHMSAGSLRSRAGFLLLRPATGELFVWLGACATACHRCVTQAVADAWHRDKQGVPPELGVPVGVMIQPPQLITQDDEPEHFKRAFPDWNESYGDLSDAAVIDLCGDDSVAAPSNPSSSPSSNSPADAASSQSIDGRDATPLLFHLSACDTSGVMSAVLLASGHAPAPADSGSPSTNTCLMPYSQRQLYELPQPALAVLDTRQEHVFVWQGWRSSSGELTDPSLDVRQDASSEGDAAVESCSVVSAESMAANYRWHERRRCVLQTTVQYSEASGGRRCWLVVAGLEPAAFTHLFPSWNQDTQLTLAQQLNMAEGYGRGFCRAASQVLAELSRSQFPLSVIKSRPLPDSVNPVTLENYLSEEDFQKALGMQRSEFKALATWRQIKLKKDAGLF